ncbi:hypothetical protein R3P38DRAFT_2841720 [Favolaschia claudopus]|uniref:Uncharacterized protein n=1 Tax=Favolaschia claudopus TaxID=2862362 RepID=A0AAW0E1U5_9AGAR
MNETLSAVSRWRAIRSERISSWRRHRKQRPCSVFVLVHASNRQKYQGSSCQIPSCSRHSKAPLPRSAFCPKKPRIVFLPRSRTLSLIISSCCCSDFSGTPPAGVEHGHSVPRPCASRTYSFCSRVVAVANLGGAPCRSNTAAPQDRRFYATQRRAIAIAIFTHHASLGRCDLRVHHRRRGAHRRRVWRRLGGCDTPPTGLQALSVPVAVSCTIISVIFAVLTPPICPSFPLNPLVTPIQS